ncbi:MAG: M1 family metallopeptidase [Ilyomonas sp.]
MNKRLFVSAFFTFLFFSLYAQNEKFTHADTLRGSLNDNRTWWDVTKYDITVKPDYNNKSISGITKITYKVVKESYPAFMQIDLQQPLIIDSIFLGKRMLDFQQQENVCLVHVPKQKYQSENAVIVFYHGIPKEAVRPPWDGGWIWTKDSLGRPWMSVACQGLGASVWYPCKDHQSDEPDKGATLSVIVPDTLVVVGNGRLKMERNNKDGTATYTWAVVNPINNYDIIPYIGKYVHFDEEYNGEKGKLDVSYWVLDYNLEKAKQHMVSNVNNMLKCFEHWFGPYPFYEDGYKLVDAPHLGMEHQSAVAYGNDYKNGYHTRNGNIDLSGTGWGDKWDFIIVHESGHEWFGNNITSKDVADMWVHEGFTNYSETLFTECMFGKEAANEYNYGIRKRIQNDKPVIGPYGVNHEGSGDMYYKGGNLLHTIRHSINDDEKFRQILRGLNQTFYHQTVTSKQIEDYISAQAGFDYSKVFDQYLRKTQIPELEFYFGKDDKKVYYRWINCEDGFNLPLSLYDGSATIKIFPTTQWQSTAVTPDQATLFDAELINYLYYVQAEEIKK